MKNTIRKAWIFQYSIQNLPAYIYTRIQVPGNCTQEKIYACYNIFTCPFSTSIQILPPPSRRPTPLEHRRNEQWTFRSIIFNILCMVLKPVLLHFVRRPAIPVQQEGRTVASYSLSLIWTQWKGYLPMEPFKSEMSCLGKLDFLKADLKTKNI